VRLLDSCSIVLSSYLSSQFLRSGGFAATTPTPARKRPPSTNTAGPSRVNKGKAANAPLSIHSDDDDIQEVPKGKGGKRSTRSATGTLNRKRKKDDDPEEPEDVQSEHETKKSRNRRDGEENEEGSGLEDQIQEVPPPAATKRGRGGSRKPTSRSGKGEGLVNGTARGVKGKGKTKAKVPIIDLIELESLDIEEEDARAEVENLANVINASLRPPKQGNTRTKQDFRGADDECTRLREQLQQVRFWVN